MAIFGLGTTELVVIGIVVLVLFGPTVIPKLARSLGQAKGTFREAKREFEAEAARSSEPRSVAEEDVRRTARGLGIDDKGKSVEEVKALIAQKLA